MTWKPVLLAFVTTVLLGLLLSGFLRTAPRLREAGAGAPAQIEQPVDSLNGGSGTPPTRGFYTPAAPAHETKARRAAA